MLLQIKDLAKKYASLTAVDNISFSINEGEIFGLLGPNGAGKTTTINMIAGLTDISSGEISIFGKKMSNSSLEIKKNLGVVPQEIAVFDDLTAYENVQFFGQIYGLKGNLLKKRVEESLNFVGLWDRCKDFPKKYSGGMKRRLNIACAIVHKPKLIIMDEPTVGIDPQSRNHILESVKALNKSGSTIIYTSHYMEEVDELCSRILIMDNGKIIADGDSEYLKGLISTEDKIDIDLNFVNDKIVGNVTSRQGVKKVDVRENKIIVTSEKNSKNLSSIIDAISQSGCEILSLYIEKPTLEGVFLTLTGRKLRDD
jgi:ABC-2 type transport system ATP-binding protein